MIGSHLPFTADYSDRFEPWQCSPASSAQQESVLRRAVASIRRRFRFDPLPPLNNHLRRDIGLDPLPKEQVRLWWY
jgi:hypothetical protein